MDISTPNLLLNNNNKTTTPLPSHAGSNGYLKRHSPAVVPSSPVSYKECLKNHAASSGGHALDGCGEFMPSPPSSNSLNCAACGCHRNFHRRDPDDHLLLLQVQPSPTSVQHVIEYQPHHRHHPPPPPPIGGHSSSPDSTSPPPISSSYYHYPSSSSAPHMLLALSNGTTARPPPNSTFRGINNRKRFRTKFTQDQKDRMQEFADKLGWKMQKSDQQIISDFCTNVGVEKNVLKVWMHNNKNNSSPTTAAAAAGGKKLENGDLHHYDHPPQPLMSAAAATATATNNNGSSSS